MTRFVIGALALCLGYFVLRGVLGSRRLLKEDTARLREWHSDVYSRQQAEASAFAAIRGCVRKPQRPGPNGRWIDRNDLIAHGKTEAERSSN